MYSNLGKLNNSSGIYVINNTINSDKYVGSATIFRKRRDKHIMELISGNHHNIHLQRFVNKHGIDKLSFEILSTCPKEYLIKLEQWFIDTINPKFNHCRIAGNQYGIKRSKEFCDNLSKNRTGKKLSDACKIKKSISMKEYIENNPDFIKLAHNASSKRKGYKHKDVSIEKMIKNNTRRISQDIINRILFMYKDGYYQNEICRELSISTFTTHKYLKLNNLL